MVLNPSAPGGRRYDPVAQAYAQLNEVMSKVGDLEARIAYENKFHKHWKRKAQRLQKELETLRATFADKTEGVVSVLQARPTAHSTQVKLIEQYMKRYDPADWVSLMLAVLARNVSIYPTDDQRFMIYDVPDAAAFEPVLKKIFAHRDLETAHHIQATILTPERAELMRLLGQLSGNRLDWANSLYKFDHSARTADGERVRARAMLHPDSTVAFPELFQRKAMRAYETRVLSEPANRNAQQEDGKGAYVLDLDATLIKVVEQVGRDAGSGGWATAGTEAEPHKLMLTGD